MNAKRMRPPVLANRRGAEIEADDTSSMPVTAPIVNFESPRLWSVFRRYARNHRRIARLMADNEILLERMKQVQGVAS